MTTRPPSEMSIEWMFLDIDIPVCRDFIALEEMKHGEMTRAEAKVYIAREFNFNMDRAKVIVDTIKGEEKSPVLDGFVTVPLEPTEAMIEASMKVVANYDVSVTKHEKHRRRLKAAFAAANQRGLQGERFP